MSKQQLYFEEPSLRTQFTQTVRSKIWWGRKDKEIYNIIFEHIQNAQNYFWSIEKVLF